ncbi:transposase [Desertifilum sp. FACHB-1129]|uniref:RNA-guided endonuclease InsQ/TnpB family protein n=1 Tax=unclassified Desertifilum TaxID=2621682 RepID=UPI0016873779|nr:MULTISPECIES: RNA-guided endonuclease TnpB family protein [unclassified Desertifilum]MBD2311169.1 transposase [Desertifilum sp. FACHB-1129]MBD2311178.1 transposase [Desertifilum sp. FACHB-1129]MBD2324377.1 transposase [Desertifilum sp. FACHB-866]MBD2324386.1 transposase [Desertifilum sp. FACHB-866]MBD2334391.1 transposase [Desertifilum sp. FACHB-868]
MILTYCYRIKPSKKQQAAMLYTLELLRRHWNYALGQRLDWLRRTRCQIDRCSMISEPIGEIPTTVNYYAQQSDLKQTKILFPDYKNIWSESQQVNLQRLNRAWERWLFPDKSGKRGGRPKFKKAGELRSFVYPRVNCPKAGAHLNNGVLKLSKIGQMPVIMHRPIPDGFTLKTCTIVHKADGWYCSISMQDDTVPEPMPLDEVKSAVGIDVGLKEFLTTSEGETVPVQQVYRKTHSHLARQQRKLVRKEKGSHRSSKQKNKIARIHQRIGRIRENFHYNTAHNLVKKYDLIAVEDLNIKGLARTRLSKSILDAAWGRFIAILDAVAVKCGVRVVKVNPHGTSQNCSRCGVKVPKTLSIRLHECHKCGLEIDRDENAAQNILDRALNEVGLILSARGGLGDTQPVKREAFSGWDGEQLSLF